MKTSERDSLYFVIILIGASTLTGCSGQFSLLKGASDSASLDPVPSLAISAPSIASGNSGTAFVFTVTYTDATAINLTNADINIVGTDFAGCNAVVTNGTTTTPTVTVTGCTGDGTMGISIDGNTAQDADGDQAAAHGPSTAADIRNSFIVSFNTANIEGGSSANTDVVIPLVNWVGYEFDIDWGDSSTEHVDNFGGGNGLTVSHVYTTPGIYEIKMKGVNLPWLQFCSGSDKLKIVDVKQWGPNAWWKMAFMFANCKNVQISAADKPNLSALHATGFTGLFQAAENFNSNIGHWDTLNVQNMSNAFAGALRFNSPINTWDTANVTDMRAMFNGATDFNQEIGSWNTSNVTDMGIMFLSATSFNQNISKSGSSWDTSQVTNMFGMFEDTDAFNQDISNWVFGPSLTTMEQMFLNADSFNQNLAAWSLPAGVNHNLFDSGAASWVLSKPTFPP